MKSLTKSSSSNATHWLEGALWATFTLLLLQYVLAVPRLPVFWYDEAFMLEPAWHMATTGKCISTHLPGTPENLPFGMNYPLFMLLLAGWIKLFGFSLFAIRLLPLILTFSAIAIAIVALRRMNVLRGRMQVLLLLVLWMLTQPVFYAAHQARPESLTLLLTALGVYTSTRGEHKGAVRGLFLVAFLMPFCGLYMIFPALVAAAVAFGSGVFKVRQALAVALGTFTGSASFYLIYKWTGAWESFKFVAATVGGLSILERFSRIMTSRELPITLIQASVFWLLAFILGWLWWRRKHPCNSRSLTIAITVYAVATILVIGILANFSLWYGWLYMLPLVVAFVVFGFDRAAGPAWLRGGLVLLLALVLLNRNMSRCLSYSHLLFWRATDPQIVQDILSGVTDKDDVVLGTDSAYLAVRPNVKKFHSLFLYSILIKQPASIAQALPKTSADEITLIITDRTNEQQSLMQTLEQRCGGKWAEIPVSSISKPTLPQWLSFLPSETKHFERCNYRVFRRVANSAH